MGYRLLLLLPFWCPVVACGPTAAPPPSTTEASAQAITNGDPAPNEPEVFLIESSYDTGKSAICTSTLIARRTLLTAAHCVDPLLSGATSVTVRATNKASYSQASFLDFIEVEEVRLHPSWSRTTLSHDFALLLLASAPSVTPKAWNRSDLTLLTGEPIRAVGYGQNNPTASSGAGTRRQANLTIRNVTSDHYRLGDSTSKGICFGDSGGPSFHTFSDGVEKIIGVHSTTQTGACVDGSDGRVDRHAPFIDQWLSEKETASCAADNQCRSGCPSKDPDCVCAADGTCDFGCVLTPDPDCAPANCVANGICQQSGCLTQDVDCKDDRESCQTASECQGGRCEADAEHPQPYCTHPCGAPAECSVDMACVSGTCKYAPAPQDGGTNPAADAGYSGECLVDAHCSGGGRCVTDLFSGMRRCQAPAQPQVDAGSAAPGADAGAASAATDGGEDAEEDGGEDAAEDPDLGTVIGGSGCSSAGAGLGLPLALLGVLLPTFRLTHRRRWRG